MEYEHGESDVGEVVVADGEGCRRIEWVDDSCDLLLNLFDMLSMLLVCEGKTCEVCEFREVADVLHNSFTKSTLLIL